MTTAANVDYVASVIGHDPLMSADLDDIRIPADPSAEPIKLDSSHKIRASITIPAGCKPTACCDQTATRYAIGNALVTPADKGSVFISATDSRCLSILKTDGRTDKPHYLPAKAVGIGKPAKRGFDGTTAILNGRWECDGKYVEIDESNAGRFPAAHQVVPDFGGADGDLIAVSLDVALLEKLVAAICPQSGNYTKNRVTLFMRRNQNINATDFDQREVVDAIGVLGGNGIGVVMPCCITSKRDGDSIGGELAKYHTLRDEYAKTFAQPNA